MKPQKGLTLIGFIIVMAVVGLFVFIGMKLFPVYNEYWSVVNAMKQLQAEPGISQRSPDQLRTQLMNTFYVSYVSTVKKEHIKISRASGYTLQVKYEVREPLIANLDFVAKFDKTIDLTGR